MKSERVLITGGQGFVGKLLAARLVSRGHAVFADRFDVGSADEVTRAFAFEPSVVFHLASPTDVAACERDVAMAERAIIEGTRNVLACAAPEVHLIFASSMMVYDEPTEGEHVLDEAWPARPDSVYGRCKLAAEELVRDAGRAAILRIFAHTHHSQPGSRFLSRTKSRIEAIPPGAELSVDASLVPQGRDIGGVVDLVTALDACMQARPVGTFNVCSAHARRLADLAQLMAKALGRASRLEDGGAAASAPLAIRGTFERFEQACGWRPRLDTDAELINYYLGATAA